MSRPVEIEPGVFVGLDGETHQVEAVTPAYVITSHDGQERVWTRSDIDARVGNVPILTEDLTLIETNTGGALRLEVPGSRGIGMWAAYRTGRSLTIHPDGTWTEDEG